MNNFHIYEEVGRGKDSVVYKVSERKTDIVLFMVKLISPWLLISL